MITKAMQIEQVRLILEGGTVTTRGRVSDGEIALALSSANSALLKAEYYNTIMKGDGETIPDGAMIAEYTNLPIASRDNGRCTIKLPATPMMVPERMGVFSIYPTGYPELEFIPIAPGQINIMMGDKLMSTMSPKTYTWSGSTITVHDDLPARGISNVDVKLVVCDLSNVEDNEPLPLSEDLNMQAIAQVLQLYSIEPQVPRADSKIPNPTTNQQR